VSSRSLFIYFRVRRDRAAEAIEALRGLQSAWRALWPALRAEVLQRADEPAAATEVTLMEIYRCDDGGVPLAWQTRIERDAAAALSPLLVGARQVEVFTPCA
jgi:acyl-CoA reductase-like NAD-dependent aldehyde dehydrogenase